MDTMNLGKKQEKTRQSKARKCKAPLQQRLVGKDQPDPERFVRRNRGFLRRNGRKTMLPFKRLKKLL